MNRAERGNFSFLLSFFEIETKGFTLPLASAPPRLRDFHEMSGVNIPNAMEYSIPQIYQPLYQRGWRTLDENIVVIPRDYFDLPLLLRSSRDAKSSRKCRDFKDI